MNATETISLHQQLINEAIEYKHAKKLRYPELIKVLDDRHRAAILFKNLNHQVTNGGFWVWSDNGNGKDIYVNWLLTYAAQIGTDSASKVSDILKKYQQKIKTVGATYERETVFIFQKIECDYQEISNQLMLDLEAWLATTTVA